MKPAFSYCNQVADHSVVLIAGILFSGGSWPALKGRLLQDFHHVVEYVLAGYDNRYPLQDATPTPLDYANDLKNFLAVRCISGPVHLVALGMFAGEGDAKRPDDTLDGTI